MGVLSFLITLVSGHATTNEITVLGFMQLKPILLVLGNEGTERAVNKILWNGSHFKHLTLHSPFFSISEWISEKEI